MSTKSPNQDNDVDNNEEGSVIIDLEKLKQEKGSTTDLNKIFDSAYEVEEEPVKKVSEEVKHDESTGTEEDNEYSDETDTDQSVEVPKKTLSPSQKRIVELNKKRKDAEEARGAAEERSRVLEERLKALQSNSTKQIQDTNKQALEAMVKSAERDLISAENEGNFEKKTDAIKRLTSAQVQLTAVEASIRNFQYEAEESKQKQDEAKSKQQYQDNKPSNNVDNSNIDIDEAKRLASRWLRKHPKANADESYGKLVSELSNQLLASGEFTQDTQEFWDELETMVTEVEEIKKTGNTAPTKKQTVSGGPSSKGTQTKTNEQAVNKNKVKLSPEEVSMAKRLGVSLEDYAMEKANPTNQVIMSRRR